MAKPIKHVMVDCETLAIAPNAAVIQVGFAFKNGEMNEVRELSMSPEAYKTLKGFRVDPNTIAWHKKTNTKNLKWCMEANNTLHDLAQFVRDTVNDAKEGGTYAIWLWANGTDFDIPILTNLLGEAGMLPNWGYTYVRDYRTLRELFKDIVPMGEKGDHSAGRDAWAQYEHLMNILSYLDTAVPGTRY